MIPGSANPLLLKSAAAAAGGYQVQRSLRFNSSDSAFCSRTPAVAGNRRTWTWAGWVKRSGLGAFQSLFCCIAPNLSHYLQFTIESDDCLLLYDLVATSGVALKTTQVFRDPSAWYHIVLQYNTTNATASNKVKLYVNGSEITQFSVDNRSSLTSDSSVNRAEQHSISGRQPYSTEYFNGYLADIHFIDGQALTPSSFTEVSATTGQLIPKTYTGTYGTNGFQLKFADNSSNTASTLGKDTSGNGNNWTPNNFSVTGILNYSSNVTTVATSVYSGTPATMFNGGTSIYYGVTSSSGNSSISIDLTGKGVSVSSSVRVYASFRTGQVWQINGSTVSSSGVTHPNTGWQTLSGWSAGAITSFSNSVPSGNANEIYAIEIDGVILTNNTGAGNDSLVDTPTSISVTDTGVGGEIRGNYATLNPLLPTLTPTNGNLDTPNSAGQNYSTIAISTGKWYVESTVGPITAGTACGLGLHFNPTADTGAGFYTSGAYIALLYENNLSRYEGANSNVNFYPTAGAGSILAIKIDLDSGTQTISYYVNNVLITSSNLPAGKTWFVTTRQNNNQSLNFGQRAFAYTAPSGFKALCDTNLGAPLVAKPNTVMDVALYNGNGAANTITGLAFSPDLVWMKVRSTAYNHTLIDSVRGATKTLSSSMTVQEYTEPTGPTAFTADGWSMSGDVTYVGSVNASGQTYVAWAWDAGTSTVSNTAGSITSQVRANVSAGFSVVTFTGNATAGATVGHGLGVAPEFLISKSRSDTGSWLVYHKSIGNTKYLALNSTIAEQTSSDAWNNTTPSSTVFTLGGSGAQPSGITRVAYCFSPVVGYSSMGSYVGNGSADGPMVWTGFRPKFILGKVSSTTDGWFMFDATRSPYNVANSYFAANASAAEATFTFADFLSNGFKLRATTSDWNASGQTYIYYAVAESPFQYARAR